MTEKDFPLIHERFIFLHRIESNRIESGMCNVPRVKIFPRAARIDTRPRLRRVRMVARWEYLTIDRVIGAERVLRGTRLFDESCSREIGKLITLVSDDKERKRGGKGE